MILGGGPTVSVKESNSITAVYAALALRESGFETIMVNCNPETVSTDFDTSDRLYFEPLTLEDVLEIIHIENPYGVIVHYGGQTPLKLAINCKKMASILSVLQPTALMPQRMTAFPTDLK